MWWPLDNLEQFIADHATNNVSERCLVFQIRGETNSNGTSSSSAAIPSPSHHQNLYSIFGEVSLPPFTRKIEVAMVNQAWQSFQPRLEEFRHPIISANAAIAPLVAPAAIAPAVVQPVTNHQTTWSLCTNNMRQILIFCEIDHLVASGPGYEINTVLIEKIFKLAAYHYTRVSAHIIIPRALKVENQQLISTKLQILQRTFDSWKQQQEIWKTRFNLGFVASTNKQWSQQMFPHAIWLPLRELQRFIGNHSTNHVNEKCLAFRIRGKTINSRASSSSAAIPSPSHHENLFFITGEVSLCPFSKANGNDMADQLWLSLFPLIKKFLQHTPPQQAPTSASVATPSAAAPAAIAPVVVSATTNHQRTNCCSCLTKLYRCLKCCCG